VTGGKSLKVEPEHSEADLAVGQRGQLIPGPDLVNKVAYF